MKPVVIEICGNNELSWEEEWLEKMCALCRQYGLAPQTRTDECHDLCSECMSFPYLIIEGRVLTGDTIEQLYEKLEEYLKTSQGFAGGQA